MKAAAWIDRVKEKRGWESDYKVAKELGIHRATVSGYRSKANTLDEDSAIKVALALGERPEAVILDQVAERTKNPAVRTALLEAGKRLCVYYVKCPKALAR